MVHQAFQAHKDVHVLGKNEVASSNLAVGSMPMKTTVHTTGLDKMALGVIEFISVEGHKPFLR